MLHNVGLHDYWSFRSFIEGKKRLHSPIPTFLSFENNSGGYSGGMNLKYLHKHCAYM